MSNLTNDDLDWALRYTTRRGDTDIFPLPNEYAFISKDWKRVREQIVSDWESDWTSRPLRSCLVPNGPSGFRIASQLDPIDHLLVTATVKHFASELEAVRIPAVDEYVFSYRLNPTEDVLFDPTSNFSSFVSTSERLSKSGDYSHVVVADIADFYSRILHHPIEQQLAAALPDAELAKKIYFLIRGWSQGSYTVGIPVGSDFSRIIAELILNDVDQLLRTNGIRFVRFVDDYRLFAESEAEARKHLIFLAQSLHDLHRLNLSKAKTKILETDKFESTYIETYIDKELRQLDDAWVDILDAIGIGDPYQQIELDDLDEETKKQVEEMNILGLLVDQLLLDDSDPGMIRWTIRRLQQLNIDAVAELELFQGAWYEHMSTIGTYLVNIVRTNPSLAESVAKSALEAIKLDELTLLDFHRAWILRILEECATPGLAKSVITSTVEWSGLFTEPAKYSTLTACAADYWIRGKVIDLPHLGPWPKRGLMMSTSILQADEKRHLLQGHKYPDLLESTIAVVVRNS